MPESFRFRRSWLLAVSPEDFWRTIGRTEDYPRWWTWLRSFDPVPLEPGASAACVVRAPLAYSLHFRVDVVQAVPEELLDARVTGDIEGPARLTVTPRAGGTEAGLSWELDVRAPPLRAAARVARPLLEWGHEWVVSSGVRQFRRRALHEQG